MGLNSVHVVTGHVVLASDRGEYREFRVTSGTVRCKFRGTGLGAFRQNIKARNARSTPINTLARSLSMFHIGISLSLFTWVRSSWSSFGLGFRAQDHRL